MFNLLLFQLHQDLSPLPIISQRRPTSAELLEQLERHGGRREIIAVYDAEGGPVHGGHHVREDRGASSAELGAKGKGAGCLLVSGCRLRLERLS